MNDMPFLIYLTDRQAWSIALVAPGACISKVADGEFEVPVPAAKVALRAAIAIGDEDLESRLRAAWVTP